MNQFDKVIMGGGAIGLSIAYELSRQKRRVAVVERGQFGKESSWAGAGILPPANRQFALHPYDQLRGLSYELHAEWALRLKAETGIDNEYQRCGGLYVARSAGEAAALSAYAHELAELGVRCHPMDEHRLRAQAGFLIDQVNDGRIRAVFDLPDEAQLRNPLHIQALLAACRQKGVTFFDQHEVQRFVLQGNRIQSILCGRNSVIAEQYCVCSGAWTYSLLRQLGVETGILPIRGQIVLFHCDVPPFRCVINEGPRYLVPRRDGYVLAGSTEEEAGFDKRTTTEAIRELTQFAGTLVPALLPSKVVQSWAGLRPGTFDGLPYLGAIPGLENGFVAAGHFRSGLLLSPGTAQVMSQLLCGERPEIDLGPFNVSRSAIALSPKLR